MIDLIRLPNALADIQVIGGYDSSAFVNALKLYGQDNAPKSAQGLLSPLNPLTSVKKMTSVKPSEKISGQNK